MPRDTVDGIIAYENGELDTRGIVELFSELVRTGLAWQLQGFYGRTAKTLIDRGILDRKGTINESALERILADAS